jgi:hypothetical protein
MKKFFEFIDEASIAAQQAARAGLVMDPHGSAYYRSPNGNYEFAAKNVGGRLVFYNKRQRFGQQDPRQTDSEKKLSQSTPANARPITESELREKYIAKEIFNEGDIVESTLNGMIGKIIRRGTNHLICVTENDIMFKSWIKDVVEYTEVKMDREMREPEKPNTLVGTTGYLKYATSMTPGSELGKDNLAYGQKSFSLNFINKYRKK